ncbi:hypothetical protein H9L12_09320 [Sphingomonas rhizophila]|uniref:Uncharacterized protein n=1 Tax=Sphingomonas rhizophila TaxID=2071607 RepID=A0A7G9S9I4_9SPHN|nr:hypothetical protein [Sphingomonas rhizophila]QNN64509.1 hypothetical protein H9L12_09320 [Sphingomonas rhizophila]
MSTKYLYWTMLVLCCGYALWRGRHDERVVAATAICASLATTVFIRLTSGNFATFEAGILLIDVAVMAAFLYVALTSSRFWPLYVAGLQLTTLLAHIFRLISSDLVPMAYAAAERFWSYPIMIILVIGAYRHHRRMQLDPGGAVSA